MKVNVVRTSKRKKLLINYLDELATLLRDTISSTGVRKITPSLGSASQYKYLTFSLLQIPNRSVKSNYLIMHDEKAYFYISSPDHRLLERIKNGLLEKGTFNLAGVRFKIMSIKVYKGPNFIRGTYRFSTLSPIVVKAMNNSASRKHKILYLYATDEEFQMALKLNLIKRYISYHNQVPPESTFEIKKIYQFKPVTYKIGNRYYRGNRIVFDAFGSPELLKFAFESGLGENTSLGFGMIKCIAEPKPLKARYHKKEKPLQFV